MSIADSLHRAHKARLARFAARAVPQAGTARPPILRPRYVMDRDYERAWAVAILGSTGTRRPAKQRIEDIQHATARHFGLPREAMLREDRSPAVVRPRQVAMFLARELTTKGFADIGECFGGRDHTAVMHAVKRIRLLLACDTELLRSVDCIRATLGEF